MRVGVACRDWGKTQRNRIRTAFIRIALWVLGVFIAFLPAIQASKASFSMDIYDMATSANSAGYFETSSL
jgi:hypothetical protein